MVFDFNNYKSGGVLTQSSKKLKSTKKLTLKSKNILKQLGYKLQNERHSRRDKLSLLRRIHLKDRTSNLKPQQSERVKQQ